MEDAQMRTQALMQSAIEAVKATVTAASMSTRMSGLDSKQPTSNWKVQDK